MDTILIVVGFIILVSAHQSSWLFVGGISLIAGSVLAQLLEISRNEIELMIFAMTFGILGSLLVIYFKRIMVITAAFVAGGYICLYLPGALGWDTDWINVIYVFLTALASGILTLMWGALPIILISSLLGATVVIQFLQFTSIGSTGLFIVLVVFGLVSQWILWQYSKPDTE